MAALDVGRLPPPAPPLAVTENSACCDYMDVGRLSLCGSARTSGNSLMCVAANLEDVGK